MTALPVQPPPAARGHGEGRRGGRRSGRIRRWVRRFIWAAVGLLLLALGLYATRDRTLHPLLVQSTPWLSRTFSPVDVELASIEGDWVHDLTIRGLRVRRRAAEGALVGIDIGEATVQGSLVQLVTSGKLNEDHTVSARGVRVEIDLDAPKSETPSSPSKGPLDALGGALFEVEDSQVVLRSASGDITLDGVSIGGRGTDFEPLLLGGRATTKDWDAAFGGSIEAQEDGAVGFRLDVPDGHVRGLALRLDDLVGSISPRGATVDSGSLVVGANRIDAGGVTIASSRSDGVTLGGRVGLELLDVATAREAVAAITGSEPRLRWGGRMLGTAVLTPSPGSIATGTVTLTGEEIEIEGVRLGSVRATLAADRDEVVIEELVATDTGSEVSGSGVYVRESASLRGVALHVRFDQPERYASELAFLVGVEGDIHLDGPLEAPSGGLRLRATEVRAGDFEIAGVALDGTLDAGTLNVTTLTANTQLGEVDASGRATLPIAGRPIDLVLETFSLQRGADRLALENSVPIQLASGGVRVEGLRLSGTAGRLELDIDLPPASADGDGDGTGDPSAAPTITARATALRLTPFLRGALDDRFDLGLIDGSFLVEASGPSAVVDLTLGGAQVAGADEAVRARLVGTWIRGIATLEEARVDVPGLSAYLHGTAPLRLLAGDAAGGAARGRLSAGPVELQGSLDVDAEVLQSELLGLALGKSRPEWLSRADGKLGAALDLTGAWNDLRGGIELTLADVALSRPESSVAAGDPTSDASSGDERSRPWLPAPLAGTLVLRADETITIAPSELTLGQFATITANGTLEQRLDAAAWETDWRARLKRWLDAPIELHAAVDCSDLDWVASFAPELRETGGVLHVDSTAKGTLRSPEPSGKLTLRGGTTRYRGAPAVENATIDIDLEPGQVRITRAKMELGASPVSITGNMLLGQGKPRLDFTLTGTEVLLTRTRNARLRANVDLRVQGRTNQPRISGSLAIVGGRVRSPVQFQSLLSGRPRGPQAVRRGYQLPSFGPKNVALDLHVTTADPIRLEGRIARGAIRADLRIAGNAEQPIPSGRIFFDPLELAVPAGTIAFPTGLVRFDPDSPEIPRLDLVGTTRLAGYDVTVNVEGDYDQPTIDLSSSPPLAPESLLLLVLSGQPPSAGGGLEAAGQSVALYVAKDLVRGWFSSGGFEDGDRESFLDRLEVVTGRDVSRSGVLTVEATYKLRQGLARKKDALYAVLERDSYEDYGLGVRLVLRLR